MRFLLLNQFYPPDVAPTGQYLHDLACELARRGHQVKVLCSRRSYDGSKKFPARDFIDGVEIVRLPALGFGRRGFLGKMADYASFYSSLLTTLMFEQVKPDLILSLTTPPYVGLLGKLAASWHGCRHAHWIMDLYPDVMFAHGLARNDGVMFKLLSKLTSYQLKGADSILALGPKMAAQVSIYLGGKTLLKPVSSIPLWSNSELGAWDKQKPNPLRAERGWAADETVFLYSGNMGLGHRFYEFLEAAKCLGDSKVRWVFAGGGKRRKEIEAFAKANPSARIEFLDYVPHTQLQAHLCAADVHLASLDSAWQGMMVPSKLQGSFAVGRPVIYVGGRNCETALWVQESGGGWAVDENDLPGLLRVIEHAQSADERQTRGQAAWEFAQKFFHKPTSVARIAQLLETEGNPEILATGGQIKEVEPAASEACQPANP